MSTSNFTILKQCEHCAEMFEAQKRTTRFCSHKCSSANYKLRKRQEVRKKVEAESIKRIKVKAFDFAALKEKEFLTVSEVSRLFNCSKKTVYRMIEAKELNANNLSIRLTRIRRKDIEQLFNPIKQENTNKLTSENCYRMDDIITKYNVSRNTVYGFGAKYNIERLKQNGITYYSKVDIDNLFNI